VFLLVEKNVNESRNVQKTFIGKNVRTISVTFKISLCMQSTLVRVKLRSDSKLCVKLKDKTNQIYMFID